MNLYDISTFLLGLIIPTIISFYIYYKQRANKNLAYEVLVNDNLFSFKEQLEGLKIEYKNNKADNLRVTVLSFKNTGNIPILKSDFESNIFIEFDKDSKILDVTYSSQPKNIEIIPKFENSKLELIPFLINQNDIFTIKIISNSKTADLKVHGRIIGMSKITVGQIAPQQKIKIKDFWLVVLIIINLISVSFFSTYSYLNYRFFNNNPTSFFEYFLLIIGAFMTTVCPYFLIWIVLTSNKVLNKNGS